MNSLARLLGPAPSEQSFQSFLEGRLRTERDRVRRAIESFRDGSYKHVGSGRLKAASKAKTKTKKLSPMAAKMQELFDLGLSEEEIFSLLEGGHNH